MACLKESQNWLKDSVLITYTLTGTALNSHPFKDMYLNPSLLEEVGC